MSTTGSSVRRTGTRHGGGSGGGDRVTLTNTHVTIHRHDSLRLRIRQTVQQISTSPHFGGGGGGDNGSPLEHHDIITRWIKYNTE